MIPVAKKNSQMIFVIANFFLKISQTKKFIAKTMRTFITKLLFQVFAAHLQLTNLTGMTSNIREKKEKQIQGCHTEHVFL